MMSMLKQLVAPIVLVTVNYLLQIVISESFENPSLSYAWSFVFNFVRAVAVFYAAWILAVVHDASIGRVVVGGVTIWFIDEVIIEGGWFLITGSSFLLDSPLHDGVESFIGAIALFFLLLPVSFVISILAYFIARLWRRHCVQPPKN